MFLSKIRIKQNHLEQDGILLKNSGGALNQIFTNLKNGIKSRNREPLCVLSAKKNWTRIQKERGVNPVFQTGVFYVDSVNVNVKFVVSTAVNLLKEIVFVGIAEDIDAQNAKKKQTIDPV